MLMMVAGLGAAENNAPPAPKSENHASVQDYDRQISLLKENIEKYNELARSFERKADSLQSHDFMGYRNTSAMAEECRGIVKDLETHLSTIEQQKAELIQAQAQNKK
jgi:cob(I)alamin adenosyltransferase